MRLFALDVAMGLLLVASLLSLVLNLFLYRYRRTKGPLVMMGASASFLLGSLFHVLVTFEVLPLGTVPTLVLLAVGVVMAVIAVVLWRK